ncbi:MAG: PhzF family phenazine biosynthesis isomerase [Kosmotogaceae bacterium]|nr:PhzF family phenazine biosynthesis isomerase [Kosmotogaceae bacterium]
MHRIYQVDSFTAVPFSGNPAGVCLLEGQIDEKLCLKISSEMNLSETAFVWPEGKSNTFSLKWFTPKTEVRMCGHATLATAWIQFTELGIRGEIFYETLSGRLKARLVDEMIEMNFPSEDPLRMDLEGGIGEIIGVEGDAYFSPRTEKLLYEIPAREKLETLSFDIKKLLKTDFGIKAKGLIVTCPGDERYDFYSRYYAPWVGIDEDPVTGSAHTVLGPFWSRKLNKKNLKACQLSARKGELEIELLDDKRILIRGKAVTVIRGEISI